MSDDNKNNGMITYLWGPFFWNTLHFISFGYPVEPDEEKQKKYKNFFTYLGDVLPCCFCRDSYQKFITEGETKLTDDVMKNRDSLVKWMYNIHNAVNKKLDVDYGVTVDDVKSKYETARAKCTKGENGCITPLDLKAKSYQELEKRDAPFINKDIVLFFVEYAKKRGITDTVFINAVGDNLQKYLNNKKHPLWEKRNKICRNIIHVMRCKGIPCIEPSGEFKGLPTVDETKLILLFSSTIGRNKLYEIIKNKKLQKTEITSDKYTKTKAKYLFLKNNI